METAVIKKIGFFLLVSSVLLFAKQYDGTIITIEAMLFPKIALLEQHIKQDSPAPLHITILAKEIDFDSAKKFKKEIKSIYPDSIGKREVVVNISKFESLSKEHPDAIIVLFHKPEKLREIALWANKNKIVSFSYDPYFLSYGILSSIYIGKSTKPYLNRKIIQEYGFVFDTYLLQLSNFYGD